MTDRLGLPVFIDNDANSVRARRAVLGAGRGVSDLVYLKLSMSVSAALVLRGALYPGAGGLAGQIGHITVDEQGRICRCGNRGCLGNLGWRGITARPVAVRVDKREA